MSDKPHKTDRITSLVTGLFARMPEIESARARLITESYKNTEHLPIILRRALAFKHILENIPIIIREHELVVGSSTLAPRGCQTFPEFSYEWLEAEFTTVESRAADPFYISKQVVSELIEVNKYWKGKTTSDLASSYMSPEAKESIKNNVFTVGNYFYNGVGHITVDYAKVLNQGFQGVIAEASEELSKCRPGDACCARRKAFLQAVIISCESACNYAARYAELARELAEQCADGTRKQELYRIAENCAKVPLKGAESFYEACQSFWFVQQLIQMESSGHSISPGRFDQYMYPFYRKDRDKGLLTEQFAQELLDCVWVKLNDLNKCRDAVSAEGFAGYSLFQNLVVGGQDEQGLDATNDLSYMCIQASRHVSLPQPSLSIRVWNGSPHSLLVKAAELTRTGIGLPAYYNDEVIIPALLTKGLTLEDARDYCIIGCVEPQKAGKTDGWHDAAFFNMCRPLEMVFDRNVEEFTTFEAFCNAYKEEMNKQIALLVNADNAVDAAHMERCPLPFLSGMVNDCIKRGKSVQEGGAVYNFTGPQGFGVANVADSLFAVKRLVFDEKKYTLTQFKRALLMNFGRGLESRIAEIVESVTGYRNSAADRDMCERLYNDIERIPKYGNDIEEVDLFARDCAYTYTRPLSRYKNPRGGAFQAGVYPVSANVPMGAQTGATPDGRLARTPLADGVSPMAGKDTNGPTAACNSVAKLDHGAAANGTLFNMKFHPSALRGEKGINSFISLVRSFFDQKGMHVQFNVVDRETLLEAQRNPEAYKNLVVRVAGYSALFTTLSKSLQDDIINRTEQMTAL